MLGRLSTVAAPGSYQITQGIIQPPSTPPFPAEALALATFSQVTPVAYTPRSHPFIERLIGTIRREYLDHTLFWNNVDLERKLADFQAYYNHHRTHSSLGGDTPDEAAGCTVKSQARLDNFRWHTHCKGLYQLPVAA
jgi:hypothetical protein